MEQVVVILDVFHVLTCHRTSFQESESFEVYDHFPHPKKVMRLLLGVDVMVTYRIQLSEK